MPHSIYEIDGAREVAIEFRSFSKTAGFTGVRAAFTVVPKSLVGKAQGRQHVDLHRLWHRRHTTKNNGISYIHQRGCEAVYSDEGKQQVRELVKFYLTNAKIIREKLRGLGMKVFGGAHAPYVWVENAGRFDELAILRSPAERLPRRLHARQRLRHCRRRLHPPQRVQQPRERRRSHVPNRADVKVVDRLRYATLLTICRDWHPPTNLQ